ncbi:hypothetical protein BD311DRAFT_771365 [Dichomitus squalens]|uniref:Uncharacterized protein n=1 Tax=Dichomitus squalens TaxID=114155 RepID=A0A4Q9M8H9_9APHY|nr:hypothetical protein BD311DRAFT_771365 [Dichomitus squalens]
MSSGSTQLIRRSVPNMSSVLLPAPTPAVGSSAQLLTHLGSLSSLPLPHILFDGTRAPLPSSYRPLTIDIARQSAGSLPNLPIKPDGLDPP